MKLYRISLNKLKDISPHFMPIPIGQKHSTNGTHHFERTDVNVTHNKLINIYRKLRNARLGGRLL